MRTNQTLLLGGMNGSLKKVEGVFRVSCVRRRVMTDVVESMNDGIKRVESLVYS